MKRVFYILSLLILPLCLIAQDNVREIDSGAIKIIDKNTVVLKDSVNLNNLPVLPDTILAEYSLVMDTLNNVYRKYRSSGSVKIDRNGDGSEPTFTGFTADVLYQIRYVDPVLDTETYFSETNPEKDSSVIYQDTVEVGAIKYPHVFLENPVAGQPQLWRVSFSYSGKPNNNAIGMKFILQNPISGFKRTLLITLPFSETSDNFITVTVPTYHDRFSATAPYGAGSGGYQFFVSSTVTDGNLEVVIKDIALLNYEF